MADTTKVLGWGKCSVKETPSVGDAETFNDIIDGSASLEVEEGEEMDALIEGGEAEARRKKPDKYLLKFSRRIDTVGELDAIKKGEEDVDVELTPELVGAVGVQLDSTSKRVTARYDTTDGMVADYVYKTKGATDGNGALTDVTFVKKATATNTENTENTGD